VKRVAIDFGTSNTVAARFREEAGSAESLEVPGISRTVQYRADATGETRTIHLIPSLIHYAESATYIGNQVLSRGLNEHRHTFRWMKRSIAMGASKHRKTPQGHRTPSEAAEDFLRLLVSYLSSEVDLQADEFTFTAPVEAFEDFQEWLRGVGERLGIARLRLLDEATACILDGRQAVSRDDRYVVFDFGCGTLDVSAVRLDLETDEEPRAIQLGQAGHDIGGMDVDSWIFDDFCRRHSLEAIERRALEVPLHLAAEALKISLSSSDVVEAPLTAPETDRGAEVPPRQTVYTRTCPACEGGRSVAAADAEHGCVGCLLAEKEFVRTIRDTVDRALENAAIKAGMRRRDITAVVVTGGTSLIPAVRRYLTGTFPGKVSYESPFDAVVRGACRGYVVPILAHDYAIESFNRTSGEFEFKPLLTTGTEYPTPTGAVRFWAKGSYDGMTRIGIKIFEVSRMPRRTFDVALVDASGAIHDTSRVSTGFHYICLNRDNPTFVVADPPVRLERDARRFLCSFSVDSGRRLLVSVEDRLTNRLLMKEHPVVRL
jgi:molecular chaperone DnaK